LEAAPASELVTPLLPPPDWLAMPPLLPAPSAVNLEPPHAYAVKEHSANRTLARKYWLRRLGFTTKAPGK